MRWWPSGDCPGIAGSPPDEPGRTKRWPSWGWGQEAGTSAPRRGLPLRCWVAGSRPGCELLVSHRRPRERCSSAVRPPQVVPVSRTEPRQGKRRTLSRREHAAPERRAPGGHREPSSGSGAPVTATPLARVAAPGRSSGSRVRRAWRARWSSAAAGVRNRRTPGPTETTGLAMRPREPWDSAPAATKAWCRWGCAREPGGRSPANLCLWSRVHPPRSWDGRRTRWVPRGLRRRVPGLRAWEWPLTRS